MSILSFRPAAAMLAAGVIAPMSLGVTLGYTETFPESTANWKNTTSGDMTWVPAGGPDGSSYANTTFSFNGLTPGSQPTIMRCQSNFNSSGGAFFGDYIGQGVTAVSFDIRQDSPDTLNGFIRFAFSSNPGGSGSGFPGAAFVFSLPANAWTHVTVPIGPGTPFFYEPTGTFAGIFSAVTRIQYGALVPSDLITNGASYNFDIDNVSIVPAPGAATAGLIGGAMLLRRRRN